jgi:hypothetical protein
VLFLRVVQPQRLERGAGGLVEAAGIGPLAERPIRAAAQLRVQLPPIAKRPMPASQPTGAPTAASPPTTAAPTPPRPTAPRNRTPMTIAAIPAMSWTAASSENRTKPRPLVLGDSTTAKYTIVLIGMIAAATIAAGHGERGDEAAEAGEGVIAAVYNAAVAALRVARSAAAVRVLLER